MEIWLLTMAERLLLFRDGEQRHQTFRKTKIQNEARETKIKLDKNPQFHHQEILRLSRVQQDVDSLATSFPPFLLPFLMLRDAGRLCDI